MTGETGQRVRRTLRTVVTREPPSRAWIVTRRVPFARSSTRTRDFVCSTFAAPAARTPNVCFAERLALRTVTVSRAGSSTATRMRPVERTCSRRRTGLSAEYDAPKTSA